MASLAHVVAGSVVRWPPIVGAAVLQALLLAWAGEIAVAGQFGPPVVPSQSIVPLRLCLVAAIVAAAIGTALAGFSVRSRLPKSAWPLVLALASSIVALVVTGISRELPAWRVASAEILATYWVLAPLGGLWLGCLDIRSTVRPSQRWIAHPALLPSLLSAGLIALAVFGTGSATALPAQPKSLLADLLRTSDAWYAPEIAITSLPIVQNWESQLGLAAPPPSQISIAARIPPAARLSVTAGLRPNLLLPAGAGVRFQIEWATVGESHILFDETLLQQNVNRYGDRAVIEIDLSPYVDQNGRFVFRTIPAGIPPGPVLEAAWLNPRILARTALIPAEALIRDGLLCLVVALLATVWTRVYDSDE